MWQRAKCWARWPQTNGWVPASQRSAPATAQQHRRSIVICEHPPLIALAGCWISTALIEVHTIDHQSAVTLKNKRWRHTQHAAEGAGKMRGIRKTGCQRGFCQTLAVGHVA